MASCDQKSNTLAATFDDFLAVPIRKQRWRAARVPEEHFFIGLKEILFDQVKQACGSSSGIDRVYSRPSAWAKSRMASISGCPSTP